MKERIRYRPTRRELAERRKRPQNRIGKFFDSLAYAVSPKWGMARIAARRRFAVAEKMAEHYEQKLSATWEAADVDRARGQTWLTKNLSPDSALAEDLFTIRQRSRDLYRNDAFACGAVEGCVANVFGTGIWPEPMVAPTNKSDTAKNRAKAINDQLDEIFDRWECSCDTTGLMSYAMLMQAAYRAKLVDGECFIVLSDGPGGLGSDRPIPLQCQLVDADRVSSPTGDQANPLIRMGIEYAKSGEVVAYWIRRTHPGDTIQNDQKWDRVLAENVLHDFDRIWAGQSRGIPWLSPVMNLLKDAKDFQEANLMAEQIAACYAAFVTTDVEPDELAEAARRASGDTDASDMGEDIEPGRISYLKTGQTIQFSNPARPGNTLAPYMQWQLRTVASGINYPYELLTKDFRELTYAAGRLSMIDGRMAFKARQQTFIANVLVPLWKRIVRESVISGAVDIDPVDYSEDAYKFEACQWQSPGWPWIDPEKEVGAAIEAIAAGLSSTQLELSSRGVEYDDIQTQRLKELEDKLDMIAALQEKATALGIDPAVVVTLVLDKGPGAAKPPAAGGNSPQKQKQAA